MALLKKFLGNYTLFTGLHRPHTHSRDSSTSNEAQRNNPVRLTTGHKDTPPIWMDRTLCLYGFIKEISRKLHSFHRAPPPPHTLSRLLDFL